MNFSSTFVRSPLPVEPGFVLGTDPFSPSAGRGPAPGNLDVVLAMALAPSPFPGGPHEAPAPTSSPRGALWVSALLLVQERMEPAPAAWPSPGSTKEHTEQPASPVLPGRLGAVT